MKRVLAIDTSAGTSVAIVELRDGASGASDAVTLATWHSADTMKHAENVGIAISDCLAQAELKPKQLDAVVVGRGPAPFTGLRVGIAASILFAEGAHVPLFGVVSLDAIALAEAQAGRHANGVEQLLVATDARRGEVYWAVFGGQDAAGLPVRLRGPGVAKLTSVLEQLDAAGTAYRRADAHVDAANLAQVFFAQHLAGQSSHDVSALYLREPDAVPSPGKKVSG
ncbi:MAG: hypothetical protein RLZZ304_941 [Actinomycetota bacterium]